MKINFFAHAGSIPAISTAFKIKSSSIFYFAKIFKRYNINNQIRATEVRVIDENGQNLGTMSLEKALELAQSKNLDLIEITSKVNPVVVKIYDYGKFLYQQQKEERSQRMKERSDEMKHIRLGFNIGKHDLETKARQTDEFLAQGLKVQIEIVLKGREKAHKDWAEKKIKEFLTFLKHSYKITQDIKNTPRGLIIVISP